MEKLKRSRLFNRLNSMSIRMSFVLYALFSLLIGIIICIFLISMVDRYRINLNYKYENMSTRYDIPENGSFTATYSNDQTKYTIFDTKGNEICKFNVDYQKERPVHEYVYPNHVSYIEVLPNFTSRDRLIDSALGSLNIAIIPIVLSISMCKVPRLQMARDMYRAQRRVDTLRNYLEEAESVQAGTWQQTQQFQLAALRGKAMPYANQ